MKQRSSESMALATPDCQKSDVPQPRGPPSVKIESSVPGGSWEVRSTEMQPWLITKDWTGVWCVILNRNLLRPICVSHVHTLEHLGRVNCATVSTDGKLIATGGDRSAQVFQLTSGDKIATFEESNIFGRDYIAATRQGRLCANWVVRFTPDGKFLLTAGNDGTIKVWDIQLKSLKLQLKKHNAAIIALDISRDGAYLVSGSLDGTIILWDFPRAANPRKLQMNEMFEVSSLSFSPDATLIAAAFVRPEISEERACPVMVWNADGVLVARLATDQPNAIVGFSPMGDKLFAGPFVSGSLKMWESSIGQGTESEIIWKPTLVGNKRSDWIASGVWDADGLHLTSVGGIVRDFDLWDITGGQVLFALGNDVIRTHFPN